MKRASFRKLLAGAALGLAVLGVSAGATTVQAASAKVTKDKTYQSAGVDSKWTYQVTVPDSNTTVYYNIYKTDKSDSENGWWYAQEYSYSPYEDTYTEKQDSQGNYAGYTTSSKYSASVVLGSKDYYYSWDSLTYNSGKSQEVDVSAYDYAPGKYTIEFYSYNNSEYEAAYDKAYYAGLKAAAEQYAKDKEAYYDGTTSVNPSNKGYAYYYTSDDGEEGGYSRGEYSAYKYMTKVYRADYYKTIKTFTFTVAVPEASVSSVVKSTSVQLNFDKTKNITGYEIYQKSGKKYTKLTTTTSNTYTVKKLSKKTKYTFKVKSYYADPDTGKKTYGADVIYQVTTIGSALNAKYTLSGSKVKLSWSKVTGAASYNIYRVAADSDVDTVTKGEYDNYTAWEKIATVKSSKTSYTDKTTVSGESYSYKVEAVLSNASGNSVTVSEGVWVSLNFGSFRIQSDYTKADGSETVTWAPMFDADKYVVYQNTTEYYVVPETDEDGTITDYYCASETKQKEVKTLKKSTTSYTFKAPKLSNLKNDKEAPVESDYVKYADYEIVDNEVKVYVDEDDYNADYYDSSVGKWYYWSYTYTVGGKTYTSWSDARAARTKIYADERKAYYTAYVAYKNSQQDNYNSYTIRALNGKKYSSGAINSTTYPVLGVSAKVTAKATTNGIKVSWDKISGANYYQVYRVEAGELVKDATTGVYTVTGNPTLVYNYNGYTALQKVKTTDGTVRYYRNYSYKTSYITGTSVVDISGTISDGDLKYVEETGSTHDYSYDSTTGKETEEYSEQNSGSYVDKGAKKGNLYTTGLEAGVEYQYYVVGYYDPNLADENYRSINVSDSTSTPNLYDYNEAGDPVRYSYNDDEYDYVKYAYTYDKTTGNYTYTKDTNGNYSFTYYYSYYDTKTHTIKYKTSPIYLHSVNETEVASYTYGAKKITSASYTAVKAPAAVTIKSVKVSGTTATITIKKKVKAASGYRIYRSTKKGSGYKLVGTITKNSTLTYKDTGLTKGKTYYYKVVSIAKNEAGIEFEGKASKVKSVKVKK